MTGDPITIGPRLGHITVPLRTRQVVATKAMTGTAPVVRPHPHRGGLTVPLGTIPTTDRGIAIVIRAGLRVDGLKDE